MNRFRQLSIRDRSLSPAEAELWVLAEPEQLTPATEIRGRLVGPTCPYSSTIEVAYPLRPFPKLPEGLAPLTRRVVIPEPSMWDPVSPFLYQGAIELWQDGKMCDRRELRHGLRVAQVGTTGLTWNGASLTLSALDRPSLDARELPALRQLGVNALLLHDAAPQLWGAAERLGFAIIGMPGDNVTCAVNLMPSPACFGWMLPMGWWAERETWRDFVSAAQKWRRFLGVELTDAVPALPPEVQFVVGPHDLPPIGRPRLLRPRPDVVPTDEPELGWVSQ